ncbi:hypothetical protein Tco_0717801 [Tanacetum coccineum]
MPRYAPTEHLQASEEGDHAVSDAEVADSIAIGEIGPRVSTMEGQMQVMASQMVQIQQLQTLVAEMSSREGTLMQCILGLDRRLADVERRSPRPK